MDFAANNSSESPAIYFEDFYLKRTKGGYYPGAIYVNPKDSDTYYGRIERKGTFTPNKRLTIALSDRQKEILMAFAENPEKVAKEYGKQTNFCCFCAAKLTDKRSVLVGYGPICAGKFGLPWGD